MKAQRLIDRCGWTTRTLNIKIMDLSRRLAQEPFFNPIDKYVRKIDNSTCTYCPDYQQASNGR